MGHKGDWRRRSQIDLTENDLRWQLAFCKDEMEKQKILEQLKAIEIEKKNYKQ